MEGIRFARPMLVELDDRIVPTATVVGSTLLGDGIDPTATVVGSTQFTLSHVPTLLHGPAQSRVVHSDRAEWPSPVITETGTLVYISSSFSHFTVSQTGLFDLGERQVLLVETVDVVMQGELNEEGESFYSESFVEVVSGNVDGTFVQLNIVHGRHSTSDLEMRSSTVETSSLTASLNGGAPTVLMQNAPLDAVYAHATEFVRSLQVQPIAQATLPEESVSSFVSLSISSDDPFVSLTPTPSPMFGVVAKPSVDAAIAASFLLSIEEQDEQQFAPADDQFSSFVQPVLRPTDLVPLEQDQAELTLTVSAAEPSSDELFIVFGPDPFLPLIAV